MQNPTIYTYLNQEFTAIPLFDGLSVDGISQESQADLHLADDFQSPSKRSMVSGMFVWDDRGGWCHLSEK